jgi:hypothetical protein
MAFSANSLTKDDVHNSGTYNQYEISQNFTFAGKFSGVPTDTTGYNTLIVNVNTSTNSIPCGLLIQYSPTGIDFDSNGSINYSTVFYSDTVFLNSVSNTNPTMNAVSGSFLKTYPILKQYYRIVYTPLNNCPTTLTINSRLSTQSYESSTQNSISTFDNGEENIYDALGKLRVSYPSTIIDLKIPGAGASGTSGSIGYMTNYLEICQNYSGFGETGLTGGSASLILNAGGHVKITSQSRKYCTYQPGKSLLFMGSGIIGYVGASIQSGGPTGYHNRIGYFDDLNGVYFEFASTNNNYPMSVVIRNNTTCTATHQENWNIDKMNGLGTSGLKLDFTKNQLFVIDMEMFGVGRIRFGFYAWGKIRYCHQITNLNTLYNLYNPHMTNTNLPIRYEIDGTTGGTGSITMTQMYSTVISEGGYNPSERLFSANGIITTSMVLETPLIALRGGGQNYYHQNILLKEITIGSNWGSPLPDLLLYKLRLYIDPVNSTYPSNMTGWTTVDNYTLPFVGSLSVAQYNTTGITTGFSPANSIILDQGTIISKGGNMYSNLSDMFKNLVQITGNYNNTSNILILTITNLSNGGISGLTCGTISWTEIY